MLFQSLLANQIEVGPENIVNQKLRNIQEEKKLEETFVTTIQEENALKQTMKLLKN